MHTATSLCSSTVILLGSLVNSILSWATISRNKEAIKHSPVKKDQRGLSKTKSHAIMGWNMKWVCSPLNSNYTTKYTSFIVTLSNPLQKDQRGLSKTKSHAIRGWNMKWVCSPLNSNYTTKYTSFIVTLSNPLLKEIYSFLLKPLQWKKKSKTIGVSHYST